MDIKAEWAIWSKDAGTRNDYSVLAHSNGLLGLGEFYHLLRHFAPGNPTEETGSPSALPWVILSRVGVGEELCVGISVQTKTPDKDATGRPISRTQYFCVRYSDLIESAVSYWELHAAAAKQALPSAGGELVRLTIPPMDPASLARTVREAGAATVATTAAMLLVGPVTVTGPGLPDTPARLHFLDAVAALLPYGYRAHLTGSTWSDGAAGDRFRIVFSSRAKDEASRVVWGTVPRPPAAGPARAYHALLTRLIAQDGHDFDPLETLITFLAADRAPRKFDEAAHAVDVLREFCLPQLLVAEGAVEKAAAADVRMLFTTGRLREIAPGERVRMARRLVSFADQQDVGLLRQRSAELGPGAAEELIADIVTACGSRLAEGSAGLARDYLGYAYERGCADVLLAELVRRASGVADAMPGLEAVGTLLAELIQAGPAAAAPYQETLQALADNPAAISAFLAQTAVRAGDASIESAAAWVRPIAGPLVQPFQLVAAGGRQQIDALVFDAMNRYGQRESVRFLLRAAAYLRRHLLVLPGFVAWLASRRLEDGEFSEADRRFWDGVIRDLGSADGRGLAWCDVARLVIGEAPQSLLSGQYAQPKFSEDLAAGWQELNRTVDSLRTTQGGIDAILEESLIAALQREKWRADQVQAAGVEALVRVLAPGGQRPHLLAIVLEPREALRQMPQDATPAMIAQVCVRAYEGRVSPETGVKLLYQSGVIATGAQALAVVETVYRALIQARAMGDDPERWATELVRRFTSGAYGERVATEFTQLAADRYIDDIRVGAGLLAELVQASPPGGAPALDATRAELLDGYREGIEELLKVTRRRQSRGVLGFGRGDQGPAVSQPPPAAQAPQPPQSGSVQPTGGGSE